MRIFENSMANSAESFSPPARQKRLRSQYRPSSQVKFTRPNPRFNLGRVFERRGSLLKGLLWGLGVGAVTSFGLMGGLGAGFLSPWTLADLPGISWFKGETAPSGPKSFLPYHLTRPVNLLILGIDRVEDAPPEGIEAFGGRSDTMLLLRLDPETQSAKVLSLPRDSRVLIPQVGYTKLNDANVHGGARLAAEVVSDTLEGVTIDRYVRVTTNAFRELVDLVGGVEVFVPTPMEYRDQTQKLEINLKAGLQTLNGDQAEQFARFRNDVNGDIGRVQRQEILLKALQKRLSNPALITRIPQAIGILQKSVDTNLSSEEILALANFGSQLQREKVQMVMLPGRFSQPEEFEGVSYWILSESGRRRVAEQYFDAQVEEERPLTPPAYLTVALQNATDNPQLVRQFRNYLRSQGYHNIYVGQEAPQLLSETEILPQQGDLNNAQHLQTLLGLGRLEVSSTGDLASDLTIRLGLDAQTWLNRLESAPD